MVNFPAYPQTSVDARNSEETEYSPLAEAKKAYLEETGRSKELLEIEKVRNQNKIKEIGE